MIKSDTYSYLTQGVVWFNHEWLAEAIMACFYKTGGAFLLSLLRLVLTGSIFALLFCHLERKRVPVLFAGFITVALLFLIAPGLSPARPQMFSYLLFALELFLLEQADSARPGLVFLLPFIFAFWINLHGGVLAGLAVFTIWSLARCLSLAAGKLVFRPDKNWLLALLFSFLALGINPYGFSLVIFLLKTATLPRPEISEWQPLALGSLSGAIYLALFVFAFWLSAARLLSQNSAKALTLLACLILPFLAARHLGFAALAVFFLAPIGQFFSDHKNAARLFSLPKALKQNKFMPALTASAAIVLVFMSLPRMKTITVQGDLPIGAVRLLKESNVCGNLACYFDFGSYCLWHLAPNVKVSLDGRRETVYEPKVYRQNLDFNYGVEDWQALLRAGTDMCLVSKQTASFALLSLLPDWQLVYEDGNSALFARKQSQNCLRLLRAKMEMQTPPAKTLFP